MVGKQSPRVHLNQMRRTVIVRFKSELNGILASRSLMLLITSLAAKR